MNKLVHLKMRDSDTFITGVPDFCAVPIPHDTRCVTQGNSRRLVKYVNYVKGTCRDYDRAQRS